MYVYKYFYIYIIYMKRERERRVHKVHGGIQIESIRYIYIYRILCIIHDT